MRGKARDSVFRNFKSLRFIQSCFVQSNQVDLGAQAAAFSVKVEDIPENQSMYDSVRFLKLVNFNSCYSRHSQMFSHHMDITTEFPVSFPF